MGSSDKVGFSLENVSFSRKSMFFYRKTQLICEKMGFSDYGDIRLPWAVHITKENGMFPTPPVLLMMTITVLLLMILVNHYHVQ